MNCEICGEHVRIVDFIFHTGRVCWHCIHQIEMSAMQKVMKEHERRDKISKKAVEELE